MTKIDEYRNILKDLYVWDDYLLKESGLPGPRGNLELAYAVAEEGNLAIFQRYLKYTPEMAPTNDPGEFLAFCGVVGLGRLVAEGHIELVPVIHKFAFDPRWRLREAVAMALQRWGDVDIPALASEMEKWSNSSPLEQRAAAAALCEPKLLKNPEISKMVLSILDTITLSILKNENRKATEFIALKKGLAYCWSVAVAACPECGKPLMEKWMVVEDKDIRWIMRENLKKNRLIKIDREWVEACLENF